MKTAIFDVHAALYKILKSNPEVMTLITDIYEGVAEELTYPYITLNQPLSTTVPNLTTRFEDITIVINIWSIDPSGKEEAYIILNSVIKALRFRLELEGFLMRKIALGETRVIDDVDPRIKHGIVRVTYTIQHI